jgi:hypothetical protein
MPAEVRPGPRASLTRSEVLTLSLFSQWRVFDGERAFYRYARRHLRSFFSTLPIRPQLNPLIRRHHDALVFFFRHLCETRQSAQSAYEALDCSAAPTRDAKRRGDGWLPGLADIGWSNRLGFYEGFHLLLAVTPQGIITGFGTASAKDQELAETFFSLRHCPNRRLLSVGQSASGLYLVDTGFEGKARHKRWQSAYGAQVLCRPKISSAASWPKTARRWLASLRQIVETVYDKLHNMFRLNRERPYHLDGFRSRLAAKIALHNFCIWFNRAYGRADLAFADLIDW